MSVEYESKITNTDDEAEVTVDKDKVIGSNSISNALMGTKNDNYVIDSNENCIEGKEGNWPYNYDELIEALILIDEKLEVFKANKK